MKVKPLMNGFHIDIGNRTILIFQRFGDKFCVISFVPVNWKRKKRMFKHSWTALEFVAEILESAKDYGFFQEV